jgi:hypothetical protein
MKRKVREQIEETDQQRIVVSNAWVTEDQISSNCGKKVECGFEYF